MVKFSCKFFILALIAEFIPLSFDLIFQLNNGFLPFFDLFLDLLNFLFGHKLILFLPELPIPASQFIILPHHDIEHGFIVLTLFLQNFLFVGGGRLLILLRLKVEHVLVDHVIELFIEFLDHRTQFVIHFVDLL